MGREHQPKDPDGDRQEPSAVRIDEAGDEQGRGGRTELRPEERRSRRPHREQARRDEPDKNQRPRSSIARGPRPAFRRAKLRDFALLGAPDRCAPRSPTPSRTPRAKTPIPKTKRATPPMRLRNGLRQFTALTWISKALLRCCSCAKRIFRCPGPTPAGSLATTNPGDARAPRALLCRRTRAARCRRPPRTSR